jgi:hypothetical protein
MKCIRPRLLRRWGVAALAGGIVLGAGAVASADSLGPINFEPPYIVGNINGQQGWMKTGPFDAAVASLATIPWASRYHFGTQALRISDAVTSGSFGDQTFSPGLANPAGEAPGKQSHFEASFKIGSPQRTVQTGLHMSVSPDDGFGARMSYLRFEDQADGIHVFFDDVTDPGPLPTVAKFNETEIAKLERKKAHSIKFSIDIEQGAANDVVKVDIDGGLRAKGTTWEDYYRFDPEQTPGNAVPAISKLLFRVSGTATPANLGNGFLVDKVRLLSSNPPASKADCRNDGWKTHTRDDGSPFSSKRDCLKYVKHHARDRGHDRFHRDDRHHGHHRRSPR